MSDCKTCKFYNDRGCAVQPSYWEMKQQLSNYGDLGKRIAPYLVNCSAWEATPQKTLTLTLTENEWNELAQYANWKGAMSNLIEQVKAKLPNLSKPEGDETPF